MRGLLGTKAMAVLLAVALVLGVSACAQSAPSDVDGVAEGSIVEEGAVEDGAAEDGAVENGTVEDGAAENGTVADGTAEDSTVDEPLREGWVFEGGFDYYFGEDGQPLTGLQTIDDEAYIFNDDGSLRYISNDERLDRIVCGIIRDKTGFDTREAYDFVANSFTYVRQPIDTDFADWEETYALNLIDTGEGNCYNYSALYNFLLRAMGYDCRTIDGIVSSRNTGKFYHHSWVEVYIDDATYVCDPVLERYDGSQIPSYFITYGDNEAATTWLVYELDWDGYPELSPQYP